MGKYIPVEVSLGSFMWYNKVVEEKIMYVGASPINKYYPWVHIWLHGAREPLG